MALPIVPNNKMMYEADGTTVWYSNVSTPAGPNLTLDQIVRMNSYWSTTGGSDYATYTGDKVYYYLLFPQPRDITHMAAATTGSRTLSVDTSTDAHNLYDATWTARTAPTMLQLPVSEATWRTPTAVNWPGVKAVRLSYTMWVSGTGQYFLCHLYGTRASESRLALWHETADAEIVTNDLDHGVVSFGDILYKQFRVRNLHTQDAIAPVLTTQPLTDPYVPTILFSYQGSGYEPSMTLPDIPSGATTGVISMQFRTPLAQAPSSASTRVTVTPTSWA